jgi:hypothetical protein
MSDGAASIPIVGNVIQLRAWKRGPDPDPGGLDGPRGSARGDPARPEAARLERAVRRLDRLTTDAFRTGGLPAEAETELLAILGELSMGLVHAASERAERLGDRLHSQGNVRSEA